MLARADIKMAKAFVKELTGMQLNILQMDAPAAVAFQIPQVEDLTHVRLTMESKLGVEGHFHFNAHLGCDAWVWKISNSHMICLMHFKRDRGRSNTYNVIRLVDHREYTGKYGPI